MTVAVLNAFTRALIEPRLPGWIEPRWFGSTEELYALAPEAEIGWFDSFDSDAMYGAANLAERAKWLNTLGAGVERFPLGLMRERGIVFTNGAGLSAVPIAEYVVMGMLVIAKGYREIARSQDRHEWLTEPPATGELDGSSALIVGAGGIGRCVAERLRPWGVAVTEVRRRPAPGALGVLGPDDWRGRLAEFDWVIVTVPSTPETEAMFGAAEFAAMKPGAAIVNIARGEVIDQRALIGAIESKRLGGAFLDVTVPEPLPPGDPLWTFDNVHISSHMSGRTQTGLYRRAADRFVDNLGRWERGEPLLGTVDLTLGY